MVKDSSFNSSSTEDQLSPNSNLLSPTLPASEDMVVKEEAKEWKESHINSPISIGFSPKSLCSPQDMAGFSLSPITPVSLKLSPQTPHKPTNGFTSSFSHFRLTDSGLVHLHHNHPLNHPLNINQHHPKCGDCNKTFSNDDNITLHKCQKFKCGECDFRSSVEGDMQEHVETHKSNLMKYKCGLCSQGFGEMVGLEKHLTIFHDNPYKCDSCKSVFITEEIYKSHLKTECTLPEQCGHCDVVFKDNNHLNDHIAKEHVPASPTPTLSSAAAAAAALTMSSVTMTTSSPVQTTPSPDLSLSTQALLLKHSILQKLVSDLQTGLQQTQLPTKPIPRFPDPTTHNSLLAPGDKSPNTLFNTSTLLYPTALKPMSLLSPLSTDPLLTDLPLLGALKCSQCTATFTTLDQLQSHLILHQYTVQHRCEECSREFLNKLMLEEHIKTVHETDRPFKCTHCDKTFTRSNNLQEHLRTHTGSRPYVCNFCDKSFARSSILHIHMRTHTKIKPFQCSVCPAAFSHSNSLQAHLRRHTGAKPYVCPVCSKAFRQSGTLHRHIRTHNKVKNSTPRITEKNEEKYAVPMQLPVNYSKFLQDVTKTNKENQPDLKLSLQMLQQLHRV